MSLSVLHKVQAKSAALFQAGGVRTCFTGRGQPSFDLQPYQEWRSLRRSQAEMMEELLIANPEALLLVRYPFASRLLWSVLRRHPGRVVFEHNTIETRELLLRFSNPRALLEAVAHRPRSLWGVYLGPFLREAVFGTACKQLSRAAVCVCETIRERFLESCPRKPTLLLGNGIEPDDVDPRPGRPELAGEIRMLLLCGSPWTWTGVDRMLRSLLAYRGSMAFHLHCVGTVASSVKRLAAQVPKPHRVVFHGDLSRPDVANLATHCHLGVGSLGLHRLGLGDGSTLKVREYMAMGLPFVLGYRDVDLTDRYPYALSFPADESLLNLDRVADFLNRLMQQGFSPQAMRQESLPLIAIQPKVRRLLEFLNSFQV